MVGAIGLYTCDLSHIVSFLGNAGGVGWEPAERESYADWWEFRDAKSGGSLRVEEEPPTSPFSVGKPTMLGIVHLILQWLLWMSHYNER